MITDYIDFVLLELYTSVLNKRMSVYINTNYRTFHKISKVLISLSSLFFDYLSQTPVNMLHLTSTIYITNHDTHMLP